MTSEQEAQARYFPLVLQFNSAESGRRWELNFQLLPTCKISLQGDKPRHDEIAAALEGIIAPKWLIEVIEVCAALASQAQAPTAVQPESLGASPSGTALSAPAADAASAPIAGAEDDFTLIAFEAWWLRHGQFCRAGGGDYEKTFAWRAWEAALEIPCECEARGIVSGAAGETRSGSTPKGQEPGPAGARPNETAHQENKHG